MPVSPPPYPEGKNLLAGKTILVTAAAGFVAAESRSAGVRSRENMCVCVCVARAVLEKLKFLNGGYVCSTPRVCVFCAHTL